MYKGVKYEGKHSAILTKEEYANFKRVSDQKYASKSKKHKFIYRGLIQCTLTGKYLIGEEQKGANNSGIYQYYRWHHCSKKDCKKILKASVIDILIVDAIDTLTITKKDLLSFKDDLKNITYTNQNMNEEKLKSILLKSKN